MPSSKTMPSLERKKGGPDNWVERAGGLPSYIERIAKHLHYEKGKDIGQAIAIAVNTCKRWCQGGTVTKTGAEGNKGVSAKTKALACKAVSEWEAKKAKGRVNASQTQKWSDDYAIGLMLSQGFMLTPRLNDSVNAGRYQLLLGQKRAERGLSRSDGSATQPDLLLSILFDTKLHPHGLMGRFIETLNSAKPGERVHTPDGSYARKTVGGKFDVNGTKATSVDAQTAARQVLAQSALAMHPDSLGGPTRYSSLDKGLHAHAEAALQRVENGGTQEAVAPATPPDLHHDFKQAADDLGIQGFDFQEGDGGSLHWEGKDGSFTATYDKAYDEVELTWTDGSDLHTVMAKTPKDALGLWMKKRYGVDPKSSTPAATPKADAPKFKAGDAVTHVDSDPSSPDTFIRVTKVHPDGKVDLSSKGAHGAGYEFHTHVSTADLQPHSGAQPPRNFAPDTLGEALNESGPMSIYIDGHELSPKEKGDLQNKLVEIQNQADTQGGGSHYKAQEVEKKLLADFEANYGGHKPSVSVASQSGHTADNAPAPDVHSDPGADTTKIGPDAGAGAATVESTIYNLQGGLDAEIANSGDGNVDPDVAYEVASTSIEAADGQPGVAAVSYDIPGVILDSGDVVAWDGDVEFKHLQGPELEAWAKDAKSAASDVGPDETGYAGAQALLKAIKKHVKFGTVKD